MFQFKSTSSNQSFLPITTQLRGMVRNNIDLFEVASKLSVTPRTVLKVISGRPVSVYVKMKIHTALEYDEKLIHPPKQSPIQHMLKINRLYQEKGSLRAVGEKLGLSRERVRQLLSKGANIGLFKYRPTKPPLLSRKKILSDYQKHLNFGRVAKANNISLSHLTKLRMFHKIEQEDLHAIRKLTQQRQCLEMYDFLKDQIGHNPTTTELQKSKKGHYLYTKIRRLWGSFGAFRKVSNF